MAQQGQVKWFDNFKRYGFIRVDNNKEDLFVHQSAIVGEGFKTLSPGERVTFEISEDRGRQAVNVRREKSA